MTDRETLYKGLSHAAWGYFFLSFDLNLGTVSVIPQFAGYILFYLAAEKLSGERRDLLLLRPLCVLLGAWAAGDWLMSWGGGRLDGQILFLDLLVAAAGLYFQFQFLTDMAALAEACLPSGEDNLAQRLRRRRTASIILSTASSLLSVRTGWLTGEQDWRFWTTVAVAAASLVTAVLIMAGLFELRKRFRPEERQERDPGEV